MNYKSSSALLDSGTQLIIRIKVPWYQPVQVVADPFGTYNVQFAATSDDYATRVHIAAYPEVTKKKRDTADRPICPLSGSFETQQEAIEAWENGFVVTGLYESHPPQLARAVIRYLLKKNLAVGARLQDTPPPSETS